MPCASHSNDPLAVSEEVDEKDRIMDMMDEDEEFQFAFGAYFILGVIDLFVVFHIAFTCTRDCDCS